MDSEKIKRLCKQAIDKGEPVEDYKFYYDVLSLLKKQEAVEPKKESDGNPERWASWWYVCGNCGVVIDCPDMYCRHCGRAVKWD